MAQIIWSEPALHDLDAIADYIALDNPSAAQALVRRVFQYIDNLATHPEMGAKLPEPEAWRYRQIVEPPCRIFYRLQGEIVYIVHVMRAGRLLLSENLDRS